MRTKWLTIAATTAVLTVGAAWLSLRDHAPQSAIEHISVPPGFEIEIAAAPPLVERPMIVDSDEQGRLYVAESSGSGDPVEQQLAERPHSILRLEDSDGDGRYDRRTVFADKMMFPEGVMWFDGSLYVAAPPSIWKLTDSDDDGVADQREEWLDAQTLTRCANDLHGPYAGPDGWIYWTKGAFAEQTWERPGQAPFVSRASHIYRRRPEGGVVEAVLTGGMANPVEVAFTPEGERLLTATFLQHPELGRRDGFIHAVYGGVYGRESEVNDDHPQTGGLLPAMTHLGPAVPVGLSYYRSGALGHEYEGNLFATMFNLHKVTRHKLIPRGSSFETEDSDFLVSTHPDFHPTDVMEDADGSLLVVDTGGWYKLCCPTSQLAKPDVLGTIYRIRRTGAATPDDPRGLLLDWPVMTTGDLAALLDDARPAVSGRATQALAKRGETALPELRKSIQDGATTATRRNAVWAATRIAGEAARQVVRDAFADPRESVRQAAAHSASVWRDREAAPLLVEQLGRAGPALQRVAAEALGRIGDPAAVAPLLSALGATQDRVLRHSLTFALIEIADPKATRKGLRSDSLETRRAALIALDQMQGGRLGVESVLPLLTSAEPALRQSAEWIAGRHPEWGGPLGGFFRNRLAVSELGPETREGLEAQLERFVGDGAIQELLAQTAAGSGPRWSRLTALRVMGKFAQKETPPSWCAALSQALASRDDEILSAAVSTGRKLPPAAEGDSSLAHALARVGRSPNAPAAVRVEALAAAAGGLGTLETEIFRFLLAQFQLETPPAVRAAAAAALAAASLDPQQRLELADALKTVSPLELPTLLPAFDAGGDQTLGERLASALEQAQGRANLRADLVENAFRGFPAAVRKRAKVLLASLDVDLAQQKARLEKLLTTLPDGDIRRGQAVFNDAKAACSSCHRIGYLGGRSGPDLTRVGEVRTERDLIEAVVFPSASFVHSYEPIIVVTEDDQFSGVTIEETDDSVLLATGVDQQVRIARANIEEVRPGKVSIMPSGMDEQLTRQEFADLIKFLKDTRWGP